MLIQYNSQCNKQITGLFIWHTEKNMKLTWCQECHQSQTFLVPAHEGSTARTWQHVNSTSECITLSDSST